MASGVPVCFIDDSPFERALFERVYSETPGWRLVIAENYVQAREKLGGQVPILWLLDLWGNDPKGEASPRLMDQSELESAARRIPSLESLYNDLEQQAGGDAGARLNEHLKRFYTLVSGWQEVFLEAARAADQTRAYGLYNLAQVRRDYPGTTALAYTRKSQPGDLVAFLAAGGDGVLLKPHGPDDTAIEAATRAKAPALIGQMSQAINRQCAASLLLWSLSPDGPQAAYFFSLAAALEGRSRNIGPPTAEFDPYMSAYIETVRAWLALRG